MFENTKINIAGLLMAIAIFTGLGLVGYGGDDIAEFFEVLGIDNGFSIVFSKLVFGISSSISTVLWILGYSEEKDGIIINIERS